VTDHAHFRDYYFVNQNANTSRGQPVYKMWSL